MFSKFIQNYLKYWAVRYLKRVKPQIIAITGSVGKTSTKEAVFEVLKVKFGDKIRKTPGNLNTETGVPLTILGFTESPQKPWEWLPIIFAAPSRSVAEPAFEIMVLEMAADKPGDIKYLTSFIKPNVSILTSIGPSHLEKFGSIEKITEEKINLLRALDEKGVAILNIDDHEVRKSSYGGRWKKITYGINKQANLTANNIKTEIVDFEPITNFEIIYEKESFVVFLPVIGSSGNIYASLAAAATGIYFGLSSKQISEGLKKIKSAKHRMNILRGKNNVVIIDDCYNASPVSLRAALDILKKLTAKRKIAVLGGMKEIGEITDEAHHLLGEYASAICDKVVTVGELAKKYQIKNHFNLPSEAIKHLLEDLREGDILLIKASRSIGLETIVDALKKEKV